MVRSSDVTATPAGGRHGRPWRAAGAAVVVLLAMVGSGMIGASMNTAPAPRPPQPRAQAGSSVVTPDTGTDRGDPVNAEANEADEAAADEQAAQATGEESSTVRLPRSTPTTISIPRIGVNANIMSLGTNPDGTIQVPPLEQAERAGWYEPGPSPGEIGNAVIVGHVDSAKIGPAVFFQLGALQSGDTITVAREDGMQATFTVESVTSYPKESFPTELVYGPSEKASLRVVTCGGQFDEASHSYRNNIIVLATMTE